MRSCRFVQGARWHCATALVLALLLTHTVLLSSAAATQQADDATAAGSEQPLGTVQSCTPSSGPSLGGTRVTIRGTNLGSGTDIYQVLLANIGASIVSQSTSMVIVVSSLVASAAAGPIAVFSRSQSQSTGAYWSYLAVPAITQVTPSSGPLGGGRAVTIVGTSLCPTGTAPTVRFGSTSATVSSWYWSCPTAVVVWSPAATVGGPVNVSVETAVYGRAVAINGYTYNLAPNVTRIVPSTIFYSGSTDVTVTGNNLCWVSGRSSVQLVASWGATLYTSVVSSTSTQLVLRVQGQLPFWHYQLSLNMPDCGTVTVENAVTTTPSVIQSVVPPAVTTAGGSTVTVRGMSLGSGSDITQVLLGTAAATIVSQTSSQVVVLSPRVSRPAADVPVSVTSRSGGTLTQPYFFSFELSSVPVVVNAEFDPSADYINVEFSLDTDRAGLAAPGPCNAVLDAASVELLGTGATCVFTTPSTLQITVGADMLVRPYTVLVLRENATLAPTTGQYATGDFVVLPPHAPLLPSPDFSAPAVVSSCSTLVLTSQATSAGPPALLWLLQEAAAYPAIAQLLAAASAAGQTVVAIPSALLPAVSTQLTFRLNVTDTLFGYSVVSAPAVVTVAGANAPTVSVDQSRVSTLAARPLYLFAQASLPPCATARQLAFQWTQTGGPAVRLPAASAATDTLRIDPGTLMPGQQYVFQVTASVPGVPGATGAASVTVTVQYATPVVVLPATYMEAGTGTPLVLDASASFTADGAAATLVFFWSCTALGDGASCTNVIIPAVAAPTLPAGSLAPGLYLFGLTLTSTVGSVVRQGRGSVTVRVRPGSAVPQVGIRRLLDGGSAQPVNVVAPGQPLVLTAVVNVAAGVSVTSYAWALNASAAGAALDLAAPGVCATPLSNPTLVVNAGQLIPGASYTFTVTVSTAASAGGAVGSAMATLSLTVGLPPAGGSCTLTPSAQPPVALSTNFTLSCTGWNTNAPPLQYAVAVRAAGAAVETPFVDPSPFPALNGFVLPAGGPPSWNQTVIVYIVDYNGLRTRYEAGTLTLPPPVQTVSDLLTAAQQATDQLVSGAVQQGVSSAVWQASLSIASLLNLVSTNDPTQLSQAVRLREALLAAVTGVAVGGDVSTLSVVAERLAVLAAVTAAPDQLSVGALQSATNSLATLLNETRVAVAAPDLGSTPALVAGAYRSALETVGHLLNSAATSAPLARQMAQPLVEQVGAVAQTVLAGLVCGQVGAALDVTGGPALWTAMATLAAVRGTTVTVRGAVFSLPSDLVVGGGVGATDCVGVQANEFTNNPYIFAPEAAISRVSALTLRSASGAALPVANLPTAVNITLQLINPIPMGYSPECRYWSGTHWSASGCSTFAESSQRVRCACTHLTEFAVTAVPNPSGPPLGPALWIAVVSAALVGGLVVAIVLSCRYCACCVRLRARFQRPRVFTFGDGTVSAAADDTAGGAVKVSAEPSVHVVSPFTQIPVAAAKPHSAYEEL